MGCGQTEVQQGGSMSAAIQSMALAATRRMSVLEEIHGRLIEEIAPGLSDFLFESLDAKSLAGINLVLLKLEELEAQATCLEDTKRRG